MRSQARFRVPLAALLVLMLAVGTLAARTLFVSRNSASTHSSGRLDLRIDQELPLFVDGLKARLFMKIYNFTNMLNGDWGRQYDAQFSSVSIITLDEDNPLIDGAYHFDSFNDRTVTDLQEFSSLWQIRLGFEINFH